jgi:hypothetical protein
MCKSLVAPYTTAHNTHVPIAMVKWSEDAVESHSIWQEAVAACTHTTQQTHVRRLVIAAVVLHRMECICLRCHVCPWARCSFDCCKRQSVKLRPLQRTCFITDVLEGTTRTQALSLWRTTYDFRFSRRWLWRTVSSGLLRRVALVRTDVSEEPGASFIKTNSVALSPRANYNDWATATCRRNLVSTFCG